MNGGMSLPPSIGIIGGMGPWVDPVILRKCLDQQARLGMHRDQHAIPVLLAQYAALLDDRSEYLDALKRGGKTSQPRPTNPAAAAVTVARALISGGARVLGIPCNTFHAEPIFSAFEAEIGRSDTDGRVPIVNMVKSTVESVSHEGARHVGILCSNGTFRHRVFSDCLQLHGLRPVLLDSERRSYSPDEQDARRKAILTGCLEPSQDDIHHCIYSERWGIKSGRESHAGHASAKAILLRAGKRLARMGAEAVIMGCTEFTLAVSQSELTEIKLYDPLDSLAQALVHTYRKAVLRTAPA
jgi:aspartate racemase